MKIRITGNKKQSRSVPSRTIGKEYEIKYVVINDGTHIQTENLEFLSEPAASERELLAALKEITKLANNAYPTYDELKDGIKKAKDLISKYDKK